MAGTAPQSVAILRADHIGDLVLTTSLMQVLHAQGWSVDVVGQPAVSLLRNCEFVRHAETLPAICPEWPRDWKKLALWLKSRSYAATIVPFCRPAQLLLASAASGARRRIALGTTLKASLLARMTGHVFHATDFVKRPRPYFEIVASCASSLVGKRDAPLPRLTLDAQARERGRTLLHSKLPAGPRIGIHPVCLGNTCNLPTTAYRELAALVLAETSCSIVVTGSAADRSALEDWHALTGQHPGRIWISAGELDLDSLSRIVSALDAYVVPSTGPLHIAHALGVRTLTPFCPQAPACAHVWGYAPHDRTTIQPANPPCDPTRPHSGNCDFRGTISARDLLSRLSAILSAP